MNKKVGIKVIVGMVLCLSFLLCGKNMWNTGMLDVYAETDATGQWEYVIWNVGDTEVDISGYNGKETVIEIPSKVDGYTVTGIEEFAFSGRSDLKSVIIPDTVTCISTEAFSGCSGLTSITIPKSVKIFGVDVFVGCSGLESIVVDEENKVFDSRDNCNAIIETSSKKLLYGCKNTVIPKSVTSINEMAFKGCSGLKSITIPKSVKKINSGAFDKCSGLTRIVVDKNNKVYDSRNNCNAIIETSSKTLIVGCQNTVIPKGVKKIAFGVFQGCNGLKSIKIPQGVTEIDGYAFADCKNLKSITFEEGLTSIGSGTFSGCSSLKSVTLPHGLKEIGFEAFYKCTGMKSITIPDSVTTIEYKAFDKVSKDFVIFSPNGSAAHKYAKENKIKWKNSNSNSVDTFLISLSKTTYTYDGKGKKPAVVVEMGGKKLKSGTDYKVTYENNVKVGTAKAIISGMGNYTGTVTKSFTINPGKVKELKQKSTYYSNAVTLTWKKMPGVDGYKVYRATSENGTYVKVATVKGTTYKNNKLEAAKTYYYKVYAYKAKEKGEFSDVIAAGTKTNKPVLNVTAGAGKATLTWEEVDGADRYEVYMKSGKSGKYKKAKTVKAGTTVYTKSKLAKGKNYSFKIRTYRLVSGKKIYSDWSKVKTVKMK